MGVSVVYDANQFVLKRALKILHVANFGLLPKGAGFFSVAFKLSNGFARLGHNVFNFCDRDVARASALFGSRKLGIGAANRKLLAVAREFQPDIILLGHADIIHPETLAGLRRACRGARIAQWNVDPLFEPDNVARLMRKIDHVDWTFVSTAGEQLHTLGNGGRYPVAFLPNPVDSSIERSRNFEKARAELSYDVFYAAGNPNLPRFHGGRTTTSGEIVERIRQALPQLRTCTPGKDSPAISGIAYEQALGASAMGINVSRRNDVHLYSSDRIAHLAGSGILTFIDRATGYDELFNEDEFAFYSSEEEMIEQIAYFMTHDRKRREVADRGWRAYGRAFSCTKVAAYTMGVILDEVQPDAFTWHY